MNINSSHIRIFPISFDRSKGTNTWIRNSTPAPDDASAELRDYLDKNSYIIEALPSINGINDYYDPATALKDSYANGRILSEGNISKLISALTDDQKFVISYTGGVIEFVIRGHYFEATLPSNLQNTCYVGVNFKDDSKVYETLDAYDTADGSTSDVLKNVDFSSDALYEGTGEGKYDVVLPLLEKGEMPIGSQFKFTSRSIENINGGTV